MTTGPIPDHAPEKYPNLIRFFDLRGRGDAIFEFHVSKKCRDQYRFDRTIYASNGSVIFADLKASRSFAQKINTQKGKTHIHPVELNAMALIDEILHVVAGQYRERVNPEAWTGAFGYLKKKTDERTVRILIRRFLDLFPAVAVYQKRQTIEQYLAVTAHSLAVLEETLILSLANQNPAFQPFRELFDDRELAETSDYQKILAKLDEYFQTQPVYGPDNESLPNLLRAPMKAAPESLAGQLAFIRDHWRSLLPDAQLDKLLKRLARALDYIKETETRRGTGTEPALVPEFKADLTTGTDQYYHDEERFTPDTNWMPGVVMLAKHTHVWLDQLSRKYGRSITRLDEIPDEELDRLAAWGITALWLIGIWERSRASQQIKQKCGNPEALASAYAIYDYTVAAELGGEPAFENLKERGRRRRIRIAVDMVPNHTGIFSRWIVEHPDWFIQTDQPPFDRYTFSGPDLSDDPRVKIFLEDGYWNRTDAAVVFQHQETATGRVRYIYHGNDGTGLPWNDTAQLNFLQPEVRAAVIGQILAVARRSPIIRLDAAMTLTKKHIQRLWFPDPGSGGAIPSRSEHGMNRRQFNRLIPKEFWREVVDRVNAEIPDTLLLAEAFWLLEGYFVRNLGMHRVYNSAFMNMLKTEDNANFRKLIKNTLEFNPEIMKRYVNFMSNPDETPAADQFGRGDKYFGVTMMMVTIPGLPMFGHGQVEGFSEKYGMEYRRSYHDEKTDEDLVRRHEREIFPVVRKRRLFAGADNFLLYDFYDPDGKVNENVFAYSNRADGEKALVVYNNKYEAARGWINTAAARNVQGVLVRQNVDQGLELTSQNGIFYEFRDLKSGLRYLRTGREISEKGLYVQLDGFQFHVFTDFQERHDNEDADLAKLCRHLNGQGVADLSEALQEMKHGAVIAALRTLINAEEIQSLLRQPDPDLFFLQVSQFFAAVKKYTGATAEVTPLVNNLTETWKVMNYNFSKILYEPHERIQSAAEYIKAVVPVEKRKKMLLTWLALEDLGRLKAAQDWGRVSALWFDQWLFAKTIRETFADFGWDQEEAVKNTRLVRVLIAFAHVFAASEEVAGNLAAMLDNPEVRNFLGVNSYDGVWWFRKENLEELIGWVFILSVLGILRKNPDRETTVALVEIQYQAVQRLLNLAAGAGYRLDNFQAQLV
jgi:glycosidase